MDVAVASAVTLVLPGDQEVGDTAGHRRILAIGGLLWTDYLELRTAVALNRFQNIIRLESDPDDPPKPLEESRQGWRNIPEIIDVTDWLAWDPSGAEATGMAELEIWNTLDNQHLATFGIYVHPGCRRQGLGSRLLEALSAEVLRLNRRMMMTVTNDNVPAGVAFIQHVGLQPGLAARENQLRQFQRADAGDQ